MAIVLQGYQTLKMPGAQLAINAMPANQSRPTIRIERLFRKRLTTVQ
jgi:hypothetical protein